MMIHTQQRDRDNYTTVVETRERERELVCDLLLYGDEKRRTRRKEVEAHGPSSRRTLPAVNLMTSRVVYISALLLLFATDKKTHSQVASSLYDDDDDDDDDDDGRLEHRISLPLSSSSSLR